MARICYNCRKAPLAWKWGLSVNDSAVLLIEYCANCSFEISVGDLNMVAYAVSVRRGLTPRRDTDFYPQEARLVVRLIYELERRGYL